MADIAGRVTKTSHFRALLITPPASTPQPRLAGHAWTLSGTLWRLIAKQEEKSHGGLPWLSGIRRTRRMQAAGVHAFLVGEAFMRSSEPGQALGHLFPDAMTKA